MTQQSESTDLATIPGARVTTLQRAVQHALRAPRTWLRAGVIATGVTFSIPIATAAPFPPVLPLVGLFPAGGGDGSNGFVLTGADADDHSGYSVSAAGDINGDGVDDLIIGAYRADPHEESSAGESYVVFGSTQGFPPVVPLASLHPAGGGDGSRGFVLAGIDAGDESGFSVSAAGDVNGDGVDDLIIGADRADRRGESDAGESYVVFGSTQGFPALFPLASLYPTGGGDGSRGFVLTGIDGLSGYSVSGAGDVNGDGIDDVIIGAWAAGTGNVSFEGESYVVFGSAQGFPPVVPLANLLPGRGGDGSRGFVLLGIDLTDDSGTSVSAAGDINGDGIGDLIVGAPGADSGSESRAGESYVVFGSTQGFQAVFSLKSVTPIGGGDGSRGFVLTGTDEFDQSGICVSAAGDVNGDGTDDLIVGAFGGDPPGNSGAGESYVFFGSTQGFAASIPLGSLYPDGGGDGSDGFVLTGVDAGDSSGRPVSAAGDINADGVDDLIVGASFASPGRRSAAGESYVAFGSRQGFEAIFALASLYPPDGGDGSRGFVLTGIDRFDGSGKSVSSAGDLNGDGIDDLIVGAPGADPRGDSGAGESYVVFGRSPAR